MNKPIVAIKIDVDTERGTRLGVPALMNLLKSHHILASFYFSLGPDNTGRALKRIFRPGFLKKVFRTRVASVYGWRTLLNGILWPGPHIGKLHEKIMREVAEQGFEVGIHCYDHVRWQDDLDKMSSAEVEAEFKKARDEFARIFNLPASSAAAAGWQANENSLAAYDKAGLLYGSDTRGLSPFFPEINGVPFRTLQIPTTLPTLDELIGDEHAADMQLIDYYYSLLRRDQPNVLTVHAELEGMAYYGWFKDLLANFLARGVDFVSLEQLAKECHQHPETIPVSKLQKGSISGRSGTIATQDKLRT